MTRQSQVHGPVDRVELARVLADQQWRQLLDARADTLAECRQVSHAPGAAFTPARDTSVGVDTQDGGIEQFELEPPPGQPVRLVQRQIELPQADAIYFHGIKFNLVIRPGKTNKLDLAYWPYQPPSGKGQR
jgi:hypothetical protein